MRYRLEKGEWIGIQLRVFLMQEDGAWRRAAEPLRWRDARMPWMWMRPRV